MYVFNSPTTIQLLTSVFMTNLQINGPFYYYFFFIVVTLKMLI